MKLSLDRVRRTLEGAVDLPTLPNVATTLGQMVRVPHVGASEVGRLISDDQALTARVLRVVNSAYYGFPQQIHNVTHAIVILGFNKVRDVVLTASVLDTFHGRTPGFDPVAFWRHSIAAAIAADAFARTARAPCVEDAFVGGLIHDIGKLALAAYFPEAFERAVGRAREEGILLRDAELATMEFDHSAVGQVLAEKWSFPEALVEAVHRHHAPAVARRARELAAVVHVADVLARALLVGSGGDSCIPVIDESVRRDWKLGRDVLNQTLTETVAGLRRGRAFFDLIRPAPAGQE